MSGFCSSASSVLAMRLVELRSSASASASFVARSEASGCQIAHASSSGRAHARPPLAGDPTRSRAPRCDSAPGRLVGAERAAAGEEPGRDQRHRGGRLDEPGPVEQADWTPNTTGTSASVTNAIRSRVPVAPRRRRVVPVAAARSAAREQPGGAQRREQPAEQEQRRDHQADQRRGRPSSEVSSRARAASRTASVRWRRRASSKAPAPTPSSGRSLEHAEGLAPVLAARGGRGEHAAAALLRRDLRLARELVDAVADPALAEGHRGERPERHEARHGRPPRSRCACACARGRRPALGRRSRRPRPRGGAARPSAARARRSRRPRPPSPTAAGGSS